MILVSAYIQPGTVFRAPEGFNRFDHTSMIKTICNKWNLPSDFGARAASPKTADASQALTLNEPRKRNQMPAFKPRPYVPWDLPSSHKHGLTAFQRDIAGLAAAHAGVEAPQVESVGDALEFLRSSSVS